MITTKPVIRLICICLLLTSIFGCARPITQQSKISKEEIREEQKQHEQIASKSKFSVPKKRKNPELSHYHLRLEKLEPRLSEAAKKVCLKGKCEYTFKIADEPVLNAWADGKSVNVTPLIMDFFESDKELAVILSHELAHNVMRHIDKQKTNIIMGTVLDIAASVKGVDTRGLFGTIGSYGYSQSFENEADYVALYIMANAGYDISDVHNIWRKMSCQELSNIKQSFFSTHPSNPERFLRMKKTIAEIQAKKSAGVALLPNIAG